MQKTAYEMRMSDWSSDVCSSDLCKNFFAISVRIHFTYVSLWRGLQHLSCSLLYAPLSPSEILGDANRVWIAKIEMRRSEEPTSELQSLMRSSYAVFCLKKKTRHNTP